MHRVDQVLALISQIVAPLPPVAVDLPAAHGAVLAQDVSMDEDSPRFDRSQLDGFAVRSHEATSGATLSLAGQVDAGGKVFSDPVPPGTCVGINTGGVVPPWADAILMVEHASREIFDGIEFVRVLQPVKPHQGIQRQGSDAKAGQVILHAGARLTPAQLALCAAAGISTPLIRRPRVAVLSTGDELVSYATPLPLPQGKIRNSNQVMLCSLARQALGGGDSLLDLGTCPDEPTQMRRTLQRGLAEADLLVVCGGMSMGTRDLVPPLLKDLGVDMPVEKVRIKPGKPFVLGTLDQNGRRSYVAGLPGNPVSSFVTFHRFVIPMLRQMEAASEPPRIVRATIDRPLPANGDREFYQPCRLTQDQTGWRAELLNWKGSADIFTLAQASALAIQPANMPPTDAGTTLDILML